MCELLGISSKVHKDHSAILAEFFTHGKDNPHGFGLAEIDEDMITVTKEPVRAEESSRLRAKLDGSVDADIVIGHVRFATKGDVAPENTHPFTAKDESGTTWILAHNGTIFGSDVLTGYFHKQEGATDSERILLYLTDRINEAVRKSDAARMSDAVRKSGAARISDRIQTVEDVIREITPGNKVNLLMSDGSLLYVHVNCERGMYYLDDGDSAVFSTKPLLAAGDNEADRMASEVWKEVPLNTLMVYGSGQMIYRGCPHGNTFVETEEKMRYLFMDYSEI